MSPALAGGFLTTGPPGKSLAQPLNALDFLFVALAFVASCTFYNYTCQLLEGVKTTLDYLSGN